MLPLMKILETLVLLCTIARAVDLNTYSKEYFVDDSDYHLISKRIAFADHSFVYMTCKRTGIIRESICNAIMEMQDGTRKQCNITLKHIIAPFYTRPERMGNKVVFQLFTLDDWTNNCSTRKINIINMDNCANLHLDLPIGNSSQPDSQLILYHDSFHVHASNLELCGGYAQCLLRYKYNGERVGNPTNFTTKHKIVYATPVNQFHPEKGTYVIGYERKHHTGFMYATYMNHVGIETDLFSFPGSIDLPQYVKDSNENELFTTCYLRRLMGNRARCVQYDMMGREKMDTRVEMRKEHLMVNVFNLPQGGIVFLSRGCNGSPNCTTVHVKMMNSDGHEMTHFELPEVEYRCRSPSYELIVDNMETKTENCFYFACVHKQSTEKTSFKYISKCLDKRT